ncbi:MAG: prepilin peptidase [Candidatus Latescibacterota bacterium]|nr:MAG: prepilin peptidase [Candidatus Latescibacterota bacterium]
MHSDLYALVVASVTGLVVGSFLNVAIFRLPRGESVVKGRSKCPNCRVTIAWYDNIPVLSYIILRGRCRHCGSRISPRYAVVEVISAAMALLAVSQYGISLQALWTYLFLAILLVITFVDWSHRIIPDVLSLGGIVLGWVGSLICLDIRLIDSLIGTAVGGGLLLSIALAYRLVRRVEGMGGGDIKLMAMIGAFLGWQMVFPVLLIASFFGAVYGIYLMGRGGKGQTAVAFGSFLAPSATVVLVFGSELWRHYANFFLG